MARKEIRECLTFDDALELFKLHSKIHEFSNEDILKIKTIFEKIVYNSLFICRLAKEISSRGVTLAKLAFNVADNLLKDVGKAEVYKDGKVSNTTIYDLAKNLFKIEELSLKQKLGMTFIATLQRDGDKLNPEDDEFIYDLIRNRSLGAVWVQQGFYNTDEVIKKVKEIADYPIIIMTAVKKTTSIFLRLYVLFFI